MFSRRIDWLYERKTIATIDVYLGLVGAELLELCQNFPPPLAEVDFAEAETRARFQDGWSLLKPPTPQLMLELAKILDWEIDRELELIDRYMRSAAYDDVVTQAAEVDALHILHQVLWDCLLWRRETSTRGFPRARLHDAVKAFRAAISAQPESALLRY